MLEVELPDSGEGIAEGTFLEWLVEEGEEVDEDQTLAEVETDKAVVDVPAPETGKVEELQAEPGDTVEVGEVIMLLDDGKEGEQEAEADLEEEETSAGKAEDPEEEDGSVEETASSVSSSEDVLAMPRVRKMAEEKGVDLEKIDTEGRVTAEDVKAAAGSGATGTTEKEGSGRSSSEGVMATPAVRKMAREKEVDLEKVEGSGHGGKITREDVLKAAEGVSREESMEEPSTSSTSEGDVERIRMSGVRKAVADKMEQSRLNVPHVTHVEKADVTNLVELRERIKDKVDAHLTYLPFMLKAVEESMQDHPRLNAELDEENDEIVLKKHYDFNIAVDTDRGLMVPLIEDVDEKSIVELASSIGEKVEKTREGNLSNREMRPGTFSITNQGVIGGEEFTPIINPPQVAILGIGRIGETAEVVDGEVVPRHTVKLSLSYDHRVIDGADAARFMNDVVENLENPEEMLLEL